MYTKLINKLSNFQQDFLFQRKKILFYLVKKKKIKNLREKCVFINNFILGSLIILKLNIMLNLSLLVLYIMWLFLDFIIPGQVFKRKDTVSLGFSLKILGIIKFLIIFGEFPLGFFLNVLVSFTIYVLINIISLHRFNFK